jgi:hypothetical protein
MSEPSDLGISSVIDPKRKRAITYVVLGAIFIALLAIALGVFRSAKSSVTANQRADKLRAAFAAAGLPQPSRNQIVRVLGDDGGEMCDNPTNALRRANLQAQLSNGAGGPGQRPIIADLDVVQGEVLAIGVYCPEKLAEFTTYIKNDLQFDDVIKP